MDIGVLATHGCNDVAGNENGSLLGAVHVHEGFQNDGFLEGITKVSRLGSESESLTLNK